jgi:hypothetical protein
MKQLISDEKFLHYFDLLRPSMKEASQAFRKGNVHSAALLVARNASEGAIRGVIDSAEIERTSDLIKKLLPRAIDIELETAELLTLENIPSPESLEPKKDARLGYRARYARNRGNDSLICGMLFAITRDRTWADHGIRMALRGTQEMIILKDIETPPAYYWHPYATKELHWSNAMHQVRFWLEALPFLDSGISDEDRLYWMKAIVIGAEYLFKANQHEIPFNLTLNPLLPVFQVATAFPTLKFSSQWISVIQDRLERDFSTIPFSTPDGYTREGASYHNVNTRLLILSYLCASRGLNIEIPSLRKVCESAFAVQALFLCPDGSPWLIGDSNPRAHHEHWQDGHESLHLGAALFNRPEWKMMAGSCASTEPEMYNAWLMGVEGLQRWSEWPKISLESRNWKNAHAPKSCFHALRIGKGTEAHAGFLSFGMEHNHAHHDKGQALIYGYGRKLLSDPGYQYDLSINLSSHGAPAVIRRIPLGPRTDFIDHAKTLYCLEEKQISLAACSHSLYENHIVQRTLAMISPWGETGEVFWLIWDQISWKHGWPGDGNEPFEMTETVFPFQAPSSIAQISKDGFSVWSQYEGLDGPPYSQGAPSRRDLAEMHEQSDSDANIQITGLKSQRGAWDIILREGMTAASGSGAWPTPVAVFRWRGHLPHVASYVLIPYRGLRDKPFAPVTGETQDCGLHAEVELVSGKILIDLNDLTSEKPKFTLKVL